MKPKLLFSIALASLFTAACETKEIVEPKEVARLEAGIENLSYITSADGSRDNLYAEERIEPSLSGAFGQQVYTSYGFGVTSSMARSGSRSTRIELREDGSAVRSELYLKEHTPRNGWYGMSMYLPSSSWVTDSDGDCWDIITQFHGTPDSGEGNRVPPISLSTIQGRLILTVNWASQRITTRAQGKKEFDLGPVEKDKWLDIVYHVKHSYGSDGILQMWKNGRKVVDYYGPNSYNDGTTPMLKMGIYKRNWNQSSKRVIFFDDIRVGGAGASYNDVAPSGSGSSLPDTGGDDNEDTPSDTGQKVVSFTLINADTDREIQTISNGATLDLSSLPTRNLNVRANTNTTVGSVYFSLSGAVNHSKTEGSAPYSLFGDTNLNYAAWRPAIGSYTLKAIPYTAVNRGGSAGTALSINFRVTE